MSDIQDQYLASHMNLRRVIGWMGLLLPIILLMGSPSQVAHTPLDSISDYHDEGWLGVVFAGTLWAIGTSLIAYRGYDIRDHLAGVFAGSCALLITLCPHDVPGIISATHFSAAVAFFLTLAFFAIYLFTRTAPAGTPNPPSATGDKLLRHRVYRGCGITILIALLAAGIPKGLAAAGVAVSSFFTGQWLFWMESLAVWAFAISWMIKGEAGSAAMQTARNAQALTFAVGGALRAIGTLSEAAGRSKRSKLDALIGFGKIVSTIYAQRKQGK